MLASVAIITFHQLLLAWLICCRDNSPRNQQLHKHNHALIDTHCHTQPHTLSIRDDMQNTRREHLPSSWTKHPPVTVHLICCFTPPPLFAPSIIYYSNRNLFFPPLCPSLSPLSLSILYLLLPSSIFPLPSHPSLCLRSCPARLQMVLNGRITECNCFVNNSTGTR